MKKRTVYGLFQRLAKVWAPSLLLSIPSIASGELFIAVEERLSPLGESSFTVSVDTNTALEFRELLLQTPGSTGFESPECLAPVGDSCFINDGWEWSFSSFEEAQQFVVGDWSLKILPQFGFDPEETHSFSVGSFDLEAPSKSQGAFVLPPGNSTVANGVPTRVGWDTDEWEADRRSILFEFGPDRDPPRRRLFPAVAGGFRRVGFGRDDDEDIARLDYLGRLNGDSSFFADLTLTRVGDTPYPVRLLFASHTDFGPYDAVGEITPSRPFGNDDDPSFVITAYLEYRFIGDSVLLVVVPEPVTSSCLVLIITSTQLLQPRIARTRIVP